MTKGPATPPKERGRQDLNLREQSSVDFGSTPLTAWVRPRMRRPSAVQRHLSHRGGVAQMVERSLSMREVQGSIPCISTFSSLLTAPLAQWIARWTSNPKVAGSSPAGGTFPSRGRLAQWKSARSAYGRPRVRTPQCPLFFVRAPRHT